MKKNLPKGEELVQHAIEEHQEIKEDLYALDQMQIGELVMMQINESI